MCSLYALIGGSNVLSSGEEEPIRLLQVCECGVEDSFFDDVAEPVGYAHPLRSICNRRNLDRREPQQECGGQLSTVAPPSECFIDDPLLEEGAGGSVCPCLLWFYGCRKPIHLRSLHHLHVVDRVSRSGLER